MSSIRSGDGTPALERRSISPARKSAATRWGGTVSGVVPKKPMPPKWAGELRTLPWSELDRYDRASPAVDCLLLTVEEGDLKVVISRRQVDPEAGRWALPGVFVNPGPRYEDEVSRALEEKAGLSFASGLPYLEQLLSWNQPDRDPRGWVITVAYLALAPVAEVGSQLDASPVDAALATVTIPWLGEEGGPVDVSLSDQQARLALGHNDLVSQAVMRLRSKVRYAPVLLPLMPKRFTLRQLQEAFEAITGEPISRATFRKMVDDRGWVVPTRSFEPAVDHRPARLYRRS